MNQNQKYFIDARRETAAFQILPFKFKNMQKNSTTITNTTTTTTTTNNNNNDNVYCEAVIVIVL